MIKLGQALGILNISIKSMFAYRFEFIMWTILHPVYILMSYFLWKAIYASTTVVRGYEFNDLMIYLILSMMISSSTWNNIDQRLGSDVRRGYLATEITKPMSVFSLKTLKDIGFIPLLPLQMIPLAIVAVWIFHFTLPALPILLLAIISIILAIYLSYSITFCFGLTSFWLKKYSGFGMVRIGITELLSGSFIPLTFFPAIMQSIFFFMPFQYITFIPVQILLGKYALLKVVELIIIQIIWIVILQVLITVIWKRGLRRFAGVGT